MIPENEQAATEAAAERFAFRVSRYYSELDRQVPWLPTEQKTKLIAAAIRSGRFPN